MAGSAPTPLAIALAHLETRWGSAAVRLAGGEAVETRTLGALALAPQPRDDGSELPFATPAAARPQPGDEVLASGFAQLDQLLGPGGLPRAAAASLHGQASSGKTTLALHWLAQAQAQGAIAAYLDLARAFDPLEAASRGVDLRWLLILRPAHPDEGFGLAAALLAGQSIDMLLVDLPERLAARHDASLRRLAAHARRVGARLIVLEPPALGAPLHTALAEAMALRLELEQRAWLRLGRDVIGRRIGISVAKNRFGPPGRRTEIEIHYLADGELAPTTADLALADAA
jgi:recombination protein RecA